MTKEFQLFEQEKITELVNEALGQGEPNFALD